MSSKIQTILKFQTTVMYLCLLVLAGFQILVLHILTDSIGSILVVCQTDFMVLGIGSTLYDKAKKFVDKKFSSDTDENAEAIARFNAYFNCKNDIERFNICKNYIEWVHNNRIGLIMYFVPSMIAVVLFVSFSFLQFFAPEIAHHLDEKLLETLGNLQKLLETWHL